MSRPGLDFIRVPNAGTVGGLVTIFGRFYGRLLDAFFLVLLSFLCAGLLVHRSTPRTVMPNDMSRGRRGVFGLWRTTGLLAGLSGNFGKAWPFGSLIHMGIRAHRYGSEQDITS